MTVAHDEIDIFTVSDNRKRLDLEDIKRDLIKFSVMHNIDQRTKKFYQEWDKRKFSPATIVKYFNSWQEAMEACGIEYKKGSSNLIRKDEVDDNLNKFASQYPTFKRSRKNFESWQGRKISVHAVSKVYGNWFDAMSALGIACPGKSKSKKNSDDDLLEATEKVWRWTWKQRQQSPSQMDFNRYSDLFPDGVCHGTIYRRFGKMDRYLKNFSRWKKGEISKVELLSLRPEKKERKMISAKLRFELLTSAGHKCSICNQSSKDGVQLHIDHIIPVSKDGTNELTNLRVLCDECNLGRSNRYLD